MKKLKFINKCRLYLSIIKNTFLRKIVFNRIDIFLSVFRLVVMLLIQSFVWRALFSGGNTISTDFGIIDIEAMLSYVVISMIVTLVVKNQVVHSFSQKIISGHIAGDMLKPLNIKSIFFFEKVGQTFFSLIFEMPLFLLIVFIFFKIILPGPLFSVLFLFTIINSLILYFLICYIVGLLGFWFLKIWAFDLLLQDVIRLISGSFIPLWMFPKSLLFISKFLPFRLIYFTPIVVFLQKVTFIEACFLFLQQLIWIFFLFILGKIVWKLGVKKLTIQGG